MSNSWIYILVGIGIWTGMVLCLGWFSTIMINIIVGAIGTLYLKLEDDKDCDFIHKELRTFYKEFINPEGGVNMYFVGDEFAFDFVPEDAETPLWDEPEGSKIDTMLELENEMSKGK